MTYVLARYDNMYIGFFFKHIQNLSKRCLVSFTVKILVIKFESASINEKWFRTEFNITSKWIHGFSYVMNIHIIMLNISVISTTFLNTRDG